MNERSMTPLHLFFIKEFGFIGIPDFIDIQPGDGFGTLLPFETVALDVIFSPARADDYKFNLVCKTLIDRFVADRKCVQGTGLMNYAKRYDAKSRVSTV